MSELDDFRTKTLARQAEAVAALILGGPAPWWEMWSRRDPLTLAYTVGYERFTGSIDGAPAAPITIRVTHVYRRENGAWKIVHRHGDFAPVDESPPAKASTT